MKETINELYDECSDILISMREIFDETFRWGGLRLL